MTWVLCGCWVLGLFYFRKKLSIFLFLAALFAIPVGELIVSLRRPIFIDRTLIWITIPLFCCWRHGVAQLRYRPVMIVALGILATNHLLSRRLVSASGRRKIEHAGWLRGELRRTGRPGALQLELRYHLFDYYFGTNMRELYSIDTKQACRWISSPAVCWSPR